MTQYRDADDLLMGGGGPPAVKFPTIGTTVKGVVLAKASQQQKDIETGELKFYKDGNPQMQLVVTLQTDERDPSRDDDDGQRRLFAKGAMLIAIREAVKKAGKTTLDAGDELAVKYTGDGERKNRAFNAPKIYAAKVLPGVGLEDPEAPF